MSNLPDNDIRTESWSVLNCDTESMQSGVFWYLYSRLVIKILWKAKQIWKVSLCENILSISVFFWRNQPCSANRLWSGNELHVQTDIVSNAFFFHFYIYKGLLTVFAVWWWCGVCQRVSVENLGPMQLVLISRAKTNRSLKLVSRNVDNVLEYMFPLRRETLLNFVTDCAVLTIVTMQSAFEPQARNNNVCAFFFWQTDRITKYVVYINTVCEKRIVDAVKVVTSKTTLINSDLCNPAIELSQTKVKLVLKLLNDIYVLLSLLQTEIYDRERQ